MWALCCAVRPPLALTVSSSAKAAPVSMPQDPARLHGRGGAHPGHRDRCHAAGHHSAAGKGITCLAAALYQSQPLSAAKAGYPGGVCVVIGSEGQGLTDETIAACNSTVRIPMTDRVESLNAGIAGSILLWHFREESL